MAEQFVAAGSNSCQSYSRPSLSSRSVSSSEPSDTESEEVVETNASNTSTCSHSFTQAQCCCGELKNVQACTKCLELRCDHALTLDTNQKLDKGTTNINTTSSSDSDKVMPSTSQGERCRQMKKRGSTFGMSGNIPNSQEQLELESSSKAESRQSQQKHRSNNRSLEEASKNGSEEHTKHDIFARFLDYFVQLEPSAKKPIDTYQKIPAGMPLQIFVVHVLQPACIFIRSLEMEMKTKLMSVELAQRNLTNVDGQKAQYVAVKHENCFYRGQIQDVCPLLVRLIDEGKLIKTIVTDVYNLPTEFMCVTRQIAALTVPDIVPMSGDGKCHQEIFEFLQQQLLGQEIVVTVTHVLDCFRGQYYGSIEYGGQNLSSLIVERDLGRNANITEKEDSGQILPLVNPKNQKLLLPTLNPGERVTAYICHVKSSSEFYVRRDNFEAHLSEIQRTLTLLKTSGSLGTYLADVINCGTSVCVALHPADSNTLCRAICQKIDYTNETPMATVFLVDYGETVNVALNTLLEYPSYQHPLPLCYRCVLIGASPVGESVSAGVNIEKFPQNNPINLTCVYSKLNSNMVTVNLAHAQLLEGALTEGVQGDKIPGRSSPYSIDLLPPSAPLQPGEYLKTKRNIDGYHSYVVMSHRCYQMYTQLRKEAAKSITKRVSTYEFCVGDVVLYPYCGHWHRCSVISFDMENGIRHVSLDVFDVQVLTRGPASQMEQVPKSFMEVEKLGHKVLLEGIDENDIIYSGEFVKTLGNRVTYLEELKKVGKNLVVRLRTVTEDGVHMELLSRSIKQLSLWAWERLYKTGIIQHHVLVERTKSCLSPGFELSRFIHSNFCNLKKGGIHRVQIRQVIKSGIGPIYLKVTATESFWKTDHALIAKQLNMYYDTVEYQDASQMSPTYPQLVAIDKFLATGGDDTPCVWHRSLYNGNVNSYECVDCFEITQLPKDPQLNELINTHGLDIKELCPEMLKVHPLGQHLAVWAPCEAPAVNKIYEDELQVGKIVQAFIKEGSTTDLGRTWAFASIVEVTNRLQELQKEKMSKPVSI